MEPQAEYKIKERQFHGDYLNPKRNVKRHELISVSFGTLIAIIFGIIFIIGIYTIGTWISDFIQQL